MDEAIWGFDLWNTGRPGGCRAVGRDDAARRDGLRPRPRLESAGVGVGWNSAARSFGAASARWKQRRIQRRQGWAGSEITRAATRRSGSRDRARTGSGEVAED